jgi:hypothetical protein
VSAVPENVSNAALVEQIQLMRQANPSLDERAIMAAHILHTYRQDPVLNWARFLDFVLAEARANPVPPGKDLTQHTLDQLTARHHRRFNLP